jgi:transcriptional regulator with XRE-family HTH domain
LSRKRIATPQLYGAALRVARQRLGLSQAAFAELVKSTGQRIGAPNNCSKRLVQKWELGEHVPGRVYRRTLESMTLEFPREVPEPSTSVVSAAAKRLDDAVIRLASLEIELMEIQALLTRGREHQRPQGGDGGALGGAGRRAVLGASGGGHGPSVGDRSVDG